MAMTNCKECDAEVSDSAFDCPKCGAALRKAQRTVFGKIVKWGFIGFNILMLIWMVAVFNVAGEAVSSASNATEAAGAAIGTGIGAMLILGIWCFVDVILGMFFLFTRPSKN